MQYRTERQVTSWVPGILAILGLIFASSLFGQDSASDEESETTLALDETEVEGVEEDTEAEEGENVEDENMEEVVATGSRLPTADTTANMIVYDAEDIAATGATTIDDFFRKIPQQFSSTNPQTSYIGNTGDDLSGDSGGIYGAFDLATANLHGLGSANTLVLLDGQRVAGYGGSETDIVNILGIPLAAIDRIEIQLDGGSAVYGSDAIAGVVNFISKKDYTGITTTYTQENSATGSDKYTGSIVLGVNFMGIRSTITWSTDQTEPIINPKAGHASLDFRHIGPEFDYRWFILGQPGVVREWNGSVRYPGPYYSNWYIDQTFFADPDKLNSCQLPSDHSGLNATVDDFNCGYYRDYSHIDGWDTVPYENGAHLNADGFIINSTYEVSDTVEIGLQVLRNMNTSFQKHPLPFMSVVVPGSNAYNPFNRPMHVYYAPGREQENGLLLTPYTTIETSSNSANLRLRWDFHPNHWVEMRVNESRTQTDNIAFRLPLTRERYAEGTEEYYRRLSSPDPDEAFNFFGNGTRQGDFFGHFLSESSRRQGTNRVTSTEIFFKGFLWEMMGERVSYVIGKTTRATRYSNRYITTIGLSDYEFDYNAVWNGISEPVYRNESYPTEIWIPVFGETHRGWWGKELQVTLKASRSIDSSWGAIGGGSGFQFGITTAEIWSPEVGDWVEVETYTYNFGGERDIDLILYREGDTIPTYGLSYHYNDDIYLRVNRSIAIQQPDISELFDTYESFEWLRRDVLDLYDPDGPTLHPQIPYEYSYANPELDSERSVNTSYEIRWNPSFIQGFAAIVKYTKINIKGTITHTGQYAGIPEALSSDNIAVRNERGDLISLRYNHFNNFRRLQVNSELRLQYEFSRNWLGFLRTSATYSRVHENFEEPFEGWTLSYLGTAQGQDRYRGSLNLFWNKDKMSGTLIASYTPPYLNERAHYCTYYQKLNQIGRCAQFDIFDFNSYLHLDVASHTSVDATFTYDFSEKMQLKIGSQNVFNRSSPLTVRSQFGRNAVPYDPTRWNGRGRTVAITMRYITGG